MITAGRRGSDRNRCSTISPPTSRTHDATGSVGHRQVVLRPERRRVGLVGGRRNSVRHRTAVAPPGPYITNARATALRGSCCNRVTRTGHPGKRLCRTIRGAVNAERATCRVGLDSHLDGRRRCWRRTCDARVERVDKGLARIVVPRSSGCDDVSALPMTS